jgi:transcriptional regulator with XRE-family HTH domain
MPTSEDIGTRLRAARKQHGLSQRRLARQSGVSNATISLIEKGDLNPTVSTLFKILSAFPMTITEFWESDHQTAARVFYSFEDLIPIRHNKVTYWRVGDGTPDDTMTFQYERYEAGMDGGEIRIDLDHEIAGFIIEGRLELTVGDQRRVLKDGDAYRFNGRIPHRLRVIGDQPVISISCTTPPVF